jgi:hypothetical protein
MFAGGPSPGESTLTTPYTNFLSYVVIPWLGNEVRNVSYYENLTDIRWHWSRYYVAERVHMPKVTPVHAWCSGEKMDMTTV